MSEPRWNPLREHLAEFTRCETGMSRSASRTFVSDFFRIIADYVRNHEFTEIRGFGAFRWVVCKPRKCRKGLFGKGTIPSYRKITFHSKSLKERK